MADDTVTLISVGGSAEPIIFVLKEHRPGKVIFFASLDSRSQIEQVILPAIGYFPSCGYIITSDPEDVGICAFELLKSMPEELRKLKTQGWPALIAYTGGTKAMSAAVVWTSSRHPCELIYIGGEKRSKNGIGNVESGSETCLRIHNPWNRVFWHETELARQLFNRAQYGNAAGLLSMIRQRITDKDTAHLLGWLGDAFDAFHAWDTFDHRRAAKLHGVVKSAGFVHHLAYPVLPGLDTFCRQVEACIPFINSIENGRLSRAMALDLMANARRRAVLEQKFEDAVARCYSAVEKLAKITLLDQHGIDNAAVPPEMIPEALRRDFACYRTGDGTLKFGFKASFRLLAELGNPMGTAYMRNEEANGQLLGRRNEGILAHGFKPAGEADFRRFFELALSLAGITENELVQFPVFPILSIC